MRYDLFIRGYAKLRKHQAFVRHVINHVRAVVGINHADPLVHAGPTRNVSGLQGQPRKSLVDIGDDGARLIHREIAMPQDRHAIEGMQCQMALLAHFRLEVMERVGHLFVGEDEPHDVDECAAWEAVNVWIGHVGLALGGRAASSSLLRKEARLPILPILGLGFGCMMSGDAAYLTGVRVVANLPEAGDTSALARADTRLRGRPDRTTEISRHTFRNCKPSRQEGNGIAVTQHMSQSARQSAFPCPWMKSARDWEPAPERKILSGRCCSMAKWIFHRIACRRPLRPNSKRRGKMSTKRCERIRWPNHFWSKRRGGCHDVLS